MRPLIGITASLDGTKIQVQRENSDAISIAGGLPFIIPYLEEEQSIQDLAQRLDGLLLTGGGDIDPFLFGEEPVPGLGSITPERDRLEMALINEMLKQNKPILGICRGCQILGITVGGSMFQDIYTQIDDSLLQHAQKAPRYHVSHLALIQEGTLLHRIMGEKQIKVNSFHHQAIRGVPETFRISGVATDGVVEAIESLEHSFVLGVQWHPEDLYTKHPYMLKLFLAFVKACKELKK
ncbi:gamma-glutamyl-gamma-aminobutyrate hydrolase family protein [Ammoniphilus sp. YIM 78166]|uniref:gamma-glutamyl-gamma-aminobutyrate hydrolase family protein n=1 Tax=Ammoniphilus sp. YIM 78166 TaxID=1644106 RepID=UPI00106F12AD|nr:gamma-glutamyl-gamma-aminobutyrate hydrolase family protein [Ammoniphilus sp. YIM 78166]